ncbi:hypothetical protein M9H77_25229 [Catharanthus roseus]|uniref:Uncharacterized protein n=1 Tax=Catharanthus roseus TaxID=4058 RepID=A0ACC0A776_CATRO|nr:hypothetical protein M9H77_25229 [Catharanthus roseus]
MTLVHRGLPPSPPIPFRTHPSTTSYYPYTPVLYDPYGYSQPLQTSYDPYAHAPSLPIHMPGLDPTQHFSRTQIPLNDVSGPGLQLGAQFFEQLDRSIPVDSSYSCVEYGATARGNSLSDVELGTDSVMSKIAGSRQKRPEKSRPPTNPTQRKKSKNDSWEQTGPADGGPQDPVIVLSYSGHDRGFLKSRSRYVSLTPRTPIIQRDNDNSDSNISINAQDMARVADSPRSGLSTEQRAACYVLYLLGSLLFTDKSGNNVSGTLWPLVKNVSSVGLDILVFSYVCTSGESGSKVVQTSHPEFEWVQCIPAHPIRPQEHRRPANNRVYMVKNVFIKALWLEASSHLLTFTWTSIPAIPPSRCTDDYMPWFLCHTHTRIQNLNRLPRGMQLPTIAPITPHVLLDMVARELDRDDIDDATKVSRASDMIKRYHQTRR